MNIKTNATPAELSSPFFIKNEEFCRDFENYIVARNGKVKGTYNAWSYLVMGKITNPRQWSLNYKKASYSNPGSLFFSSKKQGLLTIAEWSTPWIDSQHSDFCIRKKSMADFIKKAYSDTIKDLKEKSNYVIEAKDPNLPLIRKLTTILKELFNTNEVYTINLKNEKLTINLRTEAHHFEVFEKLLKM
jgi:hypothetical protein